MAVVVWAGCGPGESGPEAEVQITHPQSGEMVNESRFRVRGEARHADTVEVGGQQTEVVGGKWDVLVEFDQGPASVTAHGGDASHTVDFTVDSHVPELTLESPDHGLYVETGTADRVTVRGRVSDSGTGLKAVTVQEGVVETDAEGTFAKEVELEDGQNVIAVRAVDEAGNAATSLRSVMYGSFVDPTDLIDPGMNVHVTQPAVETAETVVEQYLTPERVTKLLRERAQSDNFDIQSVGFDAFDVEIALKSGILGLTTTVEGLTLRADFSVSKESDDPIPLEVTVDEFTILADVEPRIDSDDKLAFRFEDTELQLDEQAIHIAVVGENGSQELDEESVRSTVRSLAKGAFERLVTDELIDRLWDPSVLKRRVEMLGRELIFEVVPTGVVVRPNTEIFIQTAVSMPADQWPDVRDVPGALNLPLSGTGAGEQAMTSDAVIDTSRPALDRIIHGVWRSGLIHQQLKGDDFAGIELPVDLTAGALAVAVDGRISEVAEGSTPAAIRLRPMLPPTVDFEDAKNDGGRKLGMTVGELMVDLMLVPDGEEPIDIGTIAVFLDLTVQVNVDGIQLDLAFETDARADLVAEPEFDLDDTEIEGIVADLLEKVPELIEEELTIEGEKDLDWVTLENPELEIRGKEDDRLSVGVDVKPNPEGIEAAGDGDEQP